MYIHVYICVVCLLDRILMIIDIHTYMYMYVCACICDGTKHARERGGRHSWIQTHTQTCMNTHAHTHTHISRIHTHTHRCMSYMGLHVNIKYTCNLHHFYTIHQMKRAETRAKKKWTLKNLHTLLFSSSFPLWNTHMHILCGYSCERDIYMYTCIHHILQGGVLYTYIHIYIYTYIHHILCIYVYITWYIHTYICIYYDSYLYISHDTYIYVMYT